MSRNTKIILGVVAGLVVLCLCACLIIFLGFGLFTRNVVQNVKTDPTQAAQIADKIALFSLPAGFQAASSINVLGVTMLVYENSTDVNQMIILMQMPISGEINQSTIQQLQQAMSRNYTIGLTNIQVIESRTVTLRGSPAQIIIQQGVNSNNVPYKQEMVAFQGMGGIAMLSITGPAATWNQSAYDQMVQSIH